MGCFLWHRQHLRSIQVTASPSCMFSCLRGFSFQPYPKYVKCKQRCSKACSTRCDRKINKFKDKKKTYRLMTNVTSPDPEVNSMSVSQRQACCEHPVCGATWSLPGENKLDIIISIRSRSVLKKDICVLTKRLLKISQLSTLTQAEGAGYKLHRTLLP